MNDPTYITLRPWEYYLLCALAGIGVGQIIVMIFFE